MARRVRGKRVSRRRSRKIRRKRKIQRGGFDIQKELQKTGLELHVPGYQFLGPGTKLKRRMARGDQGINRLDRIARQHDIDYSMSSSLQDKWKADDKMIRSIKSIQGKRTNMEKIVQRVMQAKRLLKI